MISAKKIIRLKKAERELNAFAKQSPLYQGSKSINDYYQQAMNRYNENPYQSSGAAGTHGRR